MPLVTTHRGRLRRVQWLDDVEITCDKPSVHGPAWESIRTLPLGLHTHICPQCGWETHFSIEEAFDAG